MICPVCLKEFDTKYVAWTCPHCHSGGIGYFIKYEYRATALREKEATTMQVSYNGFTGELVKLERRTQVGLCSISPTYNYDLSIYNSEKQVTHSFTGVKLEDVKLEAVKFLGGTVSFGG